ncbi:sulfurtransferase complex subunit TusB [Cellvibrio sp. OA-2007]|uniref:sulfurtransferase complex subunit TusB n=1 Tax=Cellvibrio sp. OA-2007 TaxID=529823 RepID=UPI000785AB34|nr:sulfurtransferase complex subunit TusB [Cellvibrio sp. OA-2007]
MSTLHTINKSPYSHNTLTSCLAVCSENDGILLLEDGVFGAITSAPVADELQKLIQNGISVFALISDIKARGLEDKLAPNIKLVDYNIFVQLTINHRSVQSWY